MASDRQEIPGIVVHSEESTPLFSPLPLHAYGEFDPFDGAYYNEVPNNVTNAYMPGFSMEQSYFTQGPPQFDPSYIKPCPPDSQLLYPTYSSTHGHFNFPTRSPSQDSRCSNGGSSFFTGSMPSTRPSSASSFSDLDARMDSLAVNEPINTALLFPPSPDLHLHRTMSAGDRHMPRQFDADQFSDSGHSGISESSRGRSLSRPRSASVRRNPYPQCPGHPGESRPGSSMSVEQPVWLPDGGEIVKPLVTTDRMRALSVGRRHRQNLPKFLCPVCSSDFTTKNKRDRHINAHIGVKPFPCIIEGCDRAFTSQSDRKRHETSKLHTQDR